MDRKEIIARLKNIATHAVHTAGEPISPFVMGADDGIAIYEAVSVLEKKDLWVGPGCRRAYCPFRGWGIVAPDIRPLICPFCGADLY